MYKIVPTWNNGVWEETEFQTIEDFREFIDSIFKEPGKYNFDNTSFIFNEEARKFNDVGYYCDKPFRSKDFNIYWEDQKNKCRTGVIYHNKGKTWY